MEMVAGLVLLVVQVAVERQEILVTLATLGLVGIQLLAGQVILEILARLETRVLLETLELETHPEVLANQERLEILV